MVSSSWCEFTLHYTTTVLNYVVSYLNVLWFECIFFRSIIGFLGACKRSVALLWIVSFTYHLLFAVSWLTMFSLDMNLPWHDDFSFEVSCCAPDRLDSDSCLYSLSVSLIFLNVIQQNFLAVEDLLEEFSFIVLFYRFIVTNNGSGHTNPGLRLVCILLFFFHVLHTYSDAEILNLSLCNHRYKEYKLNDYSSWFLKQVRYYCNSNKNGFLSSPFFSNSCWCFSLTTPITGKDWRAVLLNPSNAGSFQRNTRSSTFSVN